MAPRTTTSTKTAPARRDVDPTLVPLQPDMETWKNVSAGKVWINRIGDYGKPRTEIVVGGRSFNLTPQERRMNQNVVARPELDVFTNGTLQPISLIDEEWDTEMLRSSPNALGELDIEKLFKVRGEAFRDRLEQITNLATVNRLAELAREPRFNVTVQQYEIVKLRERALGEAPSPGTPSDPDGERKPRPVTPR